MTQVNSAQILNLISLNRKSGVSYYNTDSKIPVDKNRGVSYYNKDNIDNKDNKDNAIGISLIGQTTSEASPLCQEEVANPNSAETQVAEPLDSVSREEEKESGIEQAETPFRLGIENPAIVPEDVDRCLLTFYDNGETARMRYKLGITINPNSAPNEKWEFIANLNKDPRIFRKNIPEENYQFVYDFGQTMRSKCKENFNTYPMLGKIHENSKTPNSTNQKEDGCAAAVYWTGTEWRATIMLWEYVITDISLSDAFLTPKQKKDHVKGVSGVIYGPQSVSKANWQKKARPTFKDRKNKS